MLLETPLTSYQHWNTLISVQQHQQLSNLMEHLTQEQVLDISPEILRLQQVQIPLGDSTWFNMDSLKWSMALTLVEQEKSFFQVFNLLKVDKLTQAAQPSKC